METAIRFSYIILLVASQLLCISLADVYPPLQNFTQLVDHSGSSNVTFQQRYQLDTTNFRPGGPILLFQGPEVSLEIDSLQYWDFFDNAAELNGISAAIEHRFFGTSFPPGFDGSAASYATLTLENVLLDGVSFVKWIRRSVPGAENSPIFIESGTPPTLILSLDSYADRTNYRLIWGFPFCDGTNSTSEDVLWCLLQLRSR
jgi:hypothetical protein